MRLMSRGDVSRYSLQSPDLGRMFAGQPEAGLQSRGIVGDMTEDRLDLTSEPELTHSTSERRSRDAFLASNSPVVASIKGFT